MKKLIAAVFASVVALSASSAFAATDFNKTITKIGAQNGVAYISVSPALTIGAAGTCQFDIVYVADISTPAGKSYFATLLTAYSQGKPLSRIDYFNVGAAGTTCNLNLVEVN